MDDIYVPYCSIIHCSAGGRAAAPQAGGAPSLLEIQQEQARQLELKREQEVQQQKQKPKVSASRI